ncbi:uncharacterized protein LOC117039186 [Lacerta agilis]|uniref:uncharacterized protein LOC117039186 n=1 Tax=Lacerta agilis TaxID=80427 RepID=UPI00141994A7|nr:uncharacterized protein LOC117039186 [Lacerta agilis]
MGSCFERLLLLIAGGQFGLLSLCLIPVFIVLLVIMVMLMFMCWRRRFKKHRRGGRGVHSLVQKKWYNTFTFQNSKRSHPEDGDGEVDLVREELLSSSTPPKESFSSLSSYAVSETKPSETEHCIPQTNMGDQAHPLRPLPRISFEVPQGKDPLKTSQDCQLSQRSYSVPSNLKHWAQNSFDKDREQHAKTYPVAMDGVSLRARNLGNAFLTSSSQNI